MSIMPSKTITITETEVDPKVDVIALGELVTEEEQAEVVVIVSSRGERYLQRIKIDGNTYYKVIDIETAIEKIPRTLIGGMLTVSEALLDARIRKAEAEKKKRSEGAGSLLALANAGQPAAAATTNASPSQAPPPSSIGYHSRV